MAARPFLSELGCLPVSKLVAFPCAQDLFEPDGTVKDPSNRMLNQLPGLLDQLDFWALATLKQRQAVAAAATAGGK
jgi:chromate reductase, NAD(P)H dehydrogenase (quinone)